MSRKRKNKRTNQVLNIMLGIVGGAVALISVFYLIVFVTAWL